jgi:hypothetical protein
MFNSSRDTYVTPDGVIREDSYPIRLDDELEDDEQEKEPDEPVPLAQGGRHYPVWYYAEKLRKLASENKVNSETSFELDLIVGRRLKRHSITSTMK